MSRINIHLPIVPPKSTHQCATRVSINKRTQKPIVYTQPTKKAKQEQAVLADLLRSYAPSEPITDPVSVDVTWCYPHTSGTRKRDRGMMIPCATRPDSDNLQKGLFDVMTGLGFWKDDNLISQVNFSKWNGPEPFIEIRVRPAAGYQAANQQQMTLKG